MTTRGGRFEPRATPRRAFQPAFFSSFSPRISISTPSFSSFDAFLARYRLDDPALQQLATIVRGADTERLDLTPQSAGLYAISLGLSHNWSENLQSVHQFDVLASNLGTSFAADGIADDSTGFINYLFYTINDQVKAGVRQEWYKADAVSYNTITYGVNIKPVDMLVIRPEIRHMFSPGAGAAGAGHDDLFNSTVLGIDAVLSY